MPSIRHRRRYERPREQPAEHDDGEDPRPDHDGVDDPLRHGVEPTEEIRCEPDQGVPEHPLDDEEDEQQARRRDEPQDVGGRPLDRRSVGQDSALALACWNSASLRTP